MAKNKNAKPAKNFKESKKIKWISSTNGKKELSSFIKKAGKLASKVNESRQIPASAIKEPFTL